MQLRTQNISGVRMNSVATPICPTCKNKAAPDTFPQDILEFKDCFGNKPYYSSYINFYCWKCYENVYVKIYRICA